MGMILKECSSMHTLGSMQKFLNVLLGKDSRFGVNGISVGVLPLCGVYYGKPLDVSNILSSQIVLILMPLTICTLDENGEYEFSVIVAFPRCSYTIPSNNTVCMLHSTSHRYFNQDNTFPLKAEALFCKLTREECNFQHYRIPCVPFHNVFSSNCIGPLLETGEDNLSLGMCRYFSIQRHSLESVQNIPNSFHEVCRLVVYVCVITEVLKEGEIHAHIDSSTRNKITLALVNAKCSDDLVFQLLRKVYGDYAEYSVCQLVGGAQVAFDAESFGEE